MQQSAVELPVPMNVRNLLRSLPAVTGKVIQAREGFFTAGRMFALLGDDSLWLRLPPHTIAGLIQAERGHPLIEPGLPPGPSWIAIPLAETNPDEVYQWALKAHHAVRNVDRPRRTLAGRRRRSEA
jgi:hypothetical protein